MEFLRTTALDKSLGKSDERIGMLRLGRLGLQQASQLGRSSDENLLLVVDHFEEIFQFQLDRSGRTHEATEFVRLLLAAAEDHEPYYRFYAVITMRSN